MHPRDDGAVLLHAARAGADPRRRGRPRVPSLAAEPGARGRAAAHADRGALDPSVDVIEAAAIDDEQAQARGYSDGDALRHDLLRERPAGRARTAHPDPDSPIYRIQVAYRGADPRAALRETLLDPDELAAMLTRLDGIDARANRPWAIEALGLIEAWPQRRAPELAELAGWDTAPWKANVRRLKELGLTESLPVGYRLSPRGEQVVAALRGRG